MNFFFFFFKADKCTLSIHSQDWQSALESHDFYNVYSNFNHSLIRSPYIALLSIINERGVFARFRIGMSALKFLYLLYRPVVHDRGINCPFCNYTPETEVHFLLTCQK